MAKKNLDFETVNQLHRSGQLNEAKVGYLALLKSKPQDAAVLHALGILCIQQEQLTDAITYLEKAILYRPEDPSIALHLANALKIQGLYSQAIQILEKTIKNHPEYAPLYNNLGTVYYALGKFNQAIDCYQEAIKKHQSYPDAYYNLGLALSKNGKIFEAIEAYKTLLQQVPNHFAGRYLLAITLMQQENYESAIEQFLKIENEHPFHFETQSNLATAYLKIGKMIESKNHYLKAIELRPEDIQILFNLGVIYMQQGEVDHAIQFYQRAVQINPDLFELQNNLGVAFLAKDHIGFALKHFREALRIQPLNESIAYTVNALSQNQKLLSAPPDYIQSLFDAYADHYDAHLLNALDYKIPNVFQKMLTPFLPNEKKLDILDIGCGTGLTGMLFKTHAQTLTGVDLSSKMIDVAREKQIYDVLIVNNLSTFLENKIEHFDVILAGDVLVYMGDLDHLFSLINSALRPSGLFIFNTEQGENENYKMNQSGRFSHQRTYLEKCASDHQFKIISYQKSITRLQNRKPVYGHVYILKKISS